MIIRRTLLGSLFAPLLGWFKPKPHIGVDPASGESQTAVTILERPGPNIFCDLPVNRIEGLTVVDHRLFAFTESGLYEVFGNGTYAKLNNYRTAEPDQDDITGEW